MIVIVYFCIVTCIGGAAVISFIGVHEKENIIPNNDHIICFTPGIDGDSKPLLDVFTRGPAKFENGVWIFTANIPQIGYKKLRTSTQCLVIEDVVQPLSQETQLVPEPTAQP